MSRTNSKSDTDGGSLGTQRINYRSATLSNQNHRLSLDYTERKQELAELLNAAVGRVARQLLVSLPPSRRSSVESQMLYDASRDRRAASPETLAALLALESRADTPFCLSDEIRALEVRVAPTVAPCVDDAMLAEEASNAALNQAQLLAEREKSATRFAAVWEFCRKQMDATRKLADAAALRAFGRPVA